MIQRFAGTKTLRVKQAFCKVNHKIQQLRVDRSFARTQGKRTIPCRKCVKYVSKAKRCKCCFATSNPWFAWASKRQCPGEALLLVVKVVLVVFLTYPNDNEDIERTKVT